MYSVFKKPCNRQSKPFIKDMQARSVRAGASALEWLPHFARGRFLSKTFHSRPPRSQSPKMWVHHAQGCRVLGLSNGLLGLVHSKAVPQTNGLICCSAGHHGVVWRHGHYQDAVGVTCRQKNSQESTTSHTGDISEWFFPFLPPTPPSFTLFPLMITVPVALGMNYDYVCTFPTYE